MDLLAAISPQWAVNRAKARALLHRYQAAESRFKQAENRLRSYDAASKGRRLSHWLATDDGPAGANGQILHILRERSRDLVRNNAYLSNAIENIESEAIGAGIIPRIGKGGTKRLRDTWKSWAESTDCDADGRLTYYGLQALVARTVAESGECLIRRRRRPPSDGLPLGIQLQVMEPDYLADDRMGLGEIEGNVRGGIAFDRRGKRSAYHLYKQHPSTMGTLSGTKLETVRVPASDIIHVYRMDRPGQIRGIPWATPVVTRLRLLDDYEDAALERARVAACFAAFIIEPDETGIPKVVTDTEGGEEVYPTERLEPGIVEHLTPGKDVRFGTPPSDSNYEKTVETNLRAIAGGLNITYEMLSTDYSKVNFTSGRMGGLNFAKTVSKWRRNVFLPHLCDGVMGWFLDAARLEGVAGPGEVKVTWTAPRADMVDPTKETTALMARVRGGFVSMPEAIREQGRDPDEVLEEIVEWNQKLDEKGIKLDTDPRNISTAGQSQGGSNDGEESEDDSGSDSESGADDDAGADQGAEAAE